MAEEGANIPGENNRIYPYKVRGTTDSDLSVPNLLIYRCCMSLSQGQNSLVPPITW